MKPQTTTGHCEGCDQPDICREQDACYRDHRSLRRIADFMAKLHRKEGLNGES